MNHLGALRSASVCFYSFEAVEDFRIELIETVTCCKGRGM